MKVRVISIPEDIENLVERLYNDSEITNDIRIQKKLEKSKKDWELEQEEKNKIAERNVIKKPNYNDDYWESISEELEEENPELHPSLQALTRLGRTQC